MEKWNPLHIQAITQSRLFRSVEEDVILQLLRQSVVSLRHFDRDDAVALEADPLTSLGIVLEGRVQAQHTYLSGANTPLATLSAGDTIGEAVIFSREARYPATIIALESTAILFLSKQTLAQMLRNSTLMTNFIAILSDRIVMLSGRIRTLSYRTLRQRVADELLRLSKGKANLTLPVSRREMSETMGVARPSLSREMATMKSEGLIDYAGRSVTILDRQRLLQCLAID